MVYEFQVDFSQLDAFSKRLAKQLSSGDIVLLKGSMGMGKTAFVRSLMSHFSFYDVTSPTFSLVNQYHSSLFTFYHLDLYRISNQHDLLSMNVSAYLEDVKGISLIEWSENLGDFRPEFYLEMTLLKQSETVRTFMVDTTQVKDPTRFQSL
ncbi:MAG: tRNA (adenosine(37)-N6)-threonylcarbamoyltransferase complex ATPase subunit type 1 TsaE [bacterium]